MYCNKCGAQINPGEKYCTKCGSPVYGNENVNPNPTPSASATATATPVKERKSKLVAGLLAFLLGTYGAHNFYLGYTGKAVAQLLLSVLGIGYFFVPIWALIEGIMIFTGDIKEPDGTPLKES